MSPPIAGDGPPDDVRHGGQRPLRAGIGLTFAGPPLLTLLVALVWGITVIADSAQFSTAVTELAPPAYVGTALTAQTCAGFALTTLSIWLIPPVAGALGWRWAFATLAVGLPRRGRDGATARAARARRLAGVVGEARERKFCVRRRGVVG